MEIKGKMVLVTGASSGMGAAIAKEMALAGASELLLLARNENELKKVAAEIASRGGKARIYPVDLSNPDQVTAIAQRIEREADVPDIIVNNAGGGQWKFLDDTSPKEIQDMMAVPYFAAAWLTRAFLPAMRARNSGPYRQYKLGRFALRLAGRHGLYRGAMGNTGADASLARGPSWLSNRRDIVGKRPSRVAVLGAQSRQPRTDTEDREHDSGA